MEVNTMTRKKSHNQTASKENKGKVPPQPRSSNALAKQPAPPDPGRPGGGQGRVDVTGVIRDNIRVDPYITEGHPGYDETGPSEIIPAEQPTGKSRGQKSRR